MSEAWRKNEFPESILTVGMIPDLLAATLNNGTKKFLQKLSQRTKYISGNKFQLASNISRKVGVTSTNARVESVDWPIVVLDRVIEAEIFVEAIQSFSDPIVVRNHAVTPFNSRVPWVGKRNFLYPLYSKGLGQLEQAGIFGQWKKLINLAKKRRQGYEFLKGRSRSTFLRKVLHVGGNIGRKFSLWEPVSYEALKYSFAFCCGLLLVGVTCFGAECFKVLLKVGKILC
ncbi:4-aminobutyrate aminotransferase [Folsomia candida]|uniref:4-aminobutyrate aminotransferase n=1 Tax=Folsomia candida TaxID=158441 RepID=A0A226E8V1_FOLCA|nr:4-aminobutyrate aminotransferase [Folsomia candida]